MEWFTKAPEGGHPNAPTNIGRLYVRGALGEQDFDKALEWYDEGLLRGAPWAAGNGAWIIINQRPASEGPDGLVRAAKAVVMSNRAAAAEAAKLLNAADERALVVATR